MPSTYIYATDKPWNIREFTARRPELAGNWLLATDPQDLLFAAQQVSPRYIFFPHWSHIVPSEITDAFECVCFHMTDVPFGRGGSPLQNLIVRGHDQTKISALRMQQELDAGPVYAKRDLELQGSAEDIFKQAAKTIMQMVLEISEHEPDPVPQSGDATVFRRRKPEDSRIPDNADARTVYDYIRMLDAPGYPKAFLEHGSWRVRFAKASLRDGILKAEAEFEPMGCGDD